MILWNHFQNTLTFITAFPTMSLCGVAGQKLLLPFHRWRSRGLVWQHFIAVYPKFMLSRAGLYFWFLPLQSAWRYDWFLTLDKSGSKDVSLLGQTITKWVGLFHILFPFPWARSRGLWCLHGWRSLKTGRDRISESPWEGSLPAH